MLRTMDRPRDPRPDTSHRDPWRTVSPGFDLALQPRAAATSALALTDADIGRPEARLSRALLGYYVAMVLVVTLIPFRFALPYAYPDIFLLGRPTEILGNVLLFLPLGFLVRLVRPRSDPGQALRVLGLGMVLSACIEATQLFEPLRYPAVLDIVTNSLGAWLGAVAYGIAARRIRLNARLVGRLSLELPLMGLVYLLLPLLWLLSLSAGDDPAQIILLVLPGLFGGSLLASMQRYHFGPSGLLSDWGMALLAGAWMLVGTFPLLPRHPLDAILLAAIVGAGAVGIIAAPSAGENERRFEMRAIRRAAPFYALFLLGSALLPLAGRRVAWHAMLGVPGPYVLTVPDMLRMLQALGEFTLLGYLLAEMRGRLELRFRHSVRWVAAWSALAAVVVNGLSGFQPGLAASALWFAMLVFVATYGGWVYHLQRGMVRRLAGDASPEAEGHAA